jgi:hypothetical protein
MGTGGETEEKKVEEEGKKAPETAPAAGKPDGAKPATDKPADAQAPEQEYRYIDPAKVRVIRLPGGTFRAEIEGERAVLNARFLRGFPVSHRDRFIELRDGAQKHVGMLKDLKGMDGESAGRVLAALEGHYFNPVILEVTALREVFETQIWTVRTDRGEMEFSVSDSNNNVRLIPPRRLLITDTDKNAYEIPDWGRLDLASRMRIKDIAQVVPERR